MLRRFFRKAERWFWLLPGFLLWAAFPPMGETVDALFALAPLVYLTRHADARTNLKRWFANGFLFWFGTLSWMPAIVKNGGPWPLVALGWAGLAAYCALFFAGYGLAVSRYWKWTNGTGSYLLRIFGIIVIEPVAWSGFELLRGWLFGGFAWNELGVAVVNTGFGAPAAVGGVYLLSMAVVLVNGTIASIAERMLAPWTKDSVTYRLPRFSRSVETFFPALVILGIYSIPGHTGEVSAGGEAVKVAMIQRNFPCCFSTGERENPYAVYAKLAENVSVFKPDLVVLAESALVEFGDIGSSRAADFVAGLSKQCGGAAVIAGGARAEGGKLYNSAALYPSNGGAIEIYDKVHLVPFGEFIPGDKLIPLLQKLAPVGSCTPGEPKLLGGYGVAICYEDTDSALMRRYANMGAKALVFITNDSWFSRSMETVQHSWQARARAIETGLPIIRTGNSGVSGTVSSDGRASYLTGADGRLLTDRRGTMFDRLELGGARTVYAAIGDWPLAVLFSLFILTVIMVEYKNYATRRTLSM